MTKIKFRRLVCSFLTSEGRIIFNRLITTNKDYIKSAQFVIDNNNKEPFGKLIK